MDHQVPLSMPGDIPVNQQLPGEWIEINWDAGETSSITVCQFNEYEYLLKYFYDSEWLLLRTYTTPIQDALFANVQCLGCDDDDDYVRFRYYYSDEQILKVRPVRNDLYGDPQFRTSRELVEFIQNHMQGDSIYEDPYHFRRADWVIDRPEAGTSGRKRGRLSLP